MRVNKLKRFDRTCIAFAVPQARMELYVSFLTSPLYGCTCRSGIKWVLCPYVPQLWIRVTCVLWDVSKDAEARVYIDIAFVTLPAVVRMQLYLKFRSHDMSKSIFLLAGGFDSRSGALPVPVSSDRKTRFEFERPSCVILP
jgi:hypothetical protein